CSPPSPISPFPPIPYAASPLLRSVWSIGCGLGGKLGHGTKYDERRPKEIAHFKTLEFAPTAVAAGAWHAAAVAADGRVATWGWGRHGCLGHGKDQCETLPRVIENLCQKEEGGRSGGVEGGTAVGAGAGAGAGANDGAASASAASAPAGSEAAACKDESHGSRGTASHKLHPAVKACHVAAGDYTTFVVGEGGEVWSFGSAESACLGHGGGWEREEEEEGEEMDDADLHDIVLRQHRRRNRDVMQPRRVTLLEERASHPPAPLPTAPGAAPADPAASPAADAAGAAGAASPAADAAADASAALQSTANPLVPASAATPPDASSPAAATGAAATLLCRGPAEAWRGGMRGLFTWGSLPAAATAGRGSDSATTPYAAADATHTSAANAAANTTTAVAAAATAVAAAATAAAAAAAAVAVGTGPADHVTHITPIITSGTDSGSGSGSGSGDAMAVSLSGWMNSIVSSSSSSSPGLDSSSGNSSSNTNSNSNGNSNRSGNGSIGSSSSRKGKVVQISTSNAGHFDAHMLALTSDGRVLACGGGSKGQLGAPPAAGDTSFPQFVKGLVL
ncbi:unnamed protein product, partial [Closterium sp. NIES-53]